MDVTTRSKGVLVVVGLFGAASCFVDPSPSSGTATSVEDDGPSDEDDDTTDDEAEHDDGNSTDGTETHDADDCDDAGCACEVDEDCADGLDCLAGECLASVCGDGIVSGDEQCDDGNATDADGCDNDCTYTQILAVKAGGLHTCVLIEGGRVRCWGSSGRGQLGLGNNEIIGDDELPNTVPDVSLPAPAIQISAGLGEHTCALLETGSIRCWGANESGQLGHANTQDTNAPGGGVQVGATVAQVSTGAFHTCARTTSNAVRCWGLGSFGRLGYGNTATIGDDELPSSVGDVMIGGQATQLAVGGAHSCITSHLGRVRCWGRGDLGQLGYGSTANIGDVGTPATAGDASIIPMGLSPFTKVTVISTGIVHSCAAFETGDALCWGDGLQGQIGTGTTTPLGDDELPSTASALDFPGEVISISAGGAHSCALLAHGDVFCWGSNVFGQLGYGHTMMIGDDEPAAAGGPVSLGARAVQVDAGFFHTCAITEHNELRCWGNNDLGQLGLGHTNKIGDNELPIDAPPVAVF
jgi:cysteine-rich repeat protein